jgi:C4-dicarboxylate-specific signal transduction histidine kinase
MALRRDAPGRYLTVGQWLAVAAIAVLGVLAASNLWGYLRSREYLTDAAFRNIRNVAALEASETREFTRNAENLVPSIIAGNEHLFSVLRSWVAAEDAATQDAASRELRAHLAAKAAEGSAVEEFSVISPMGILVASSGLAQMPGADLSTTSCFRIGSTSPGIVGLEWPEDHAPEQEESDSHHDSYPLLLVASRIVDGEGMFLGVFCASFEFDIHRSMLVAHRERTRQAALYLLDDEGKVICGSFDDTHGVSYGETLTELEGRPTRRSPAWEGRYRDASGQEIMVAYAPVPTLDWAVVVEVPVIQALADLERLKWQALAGSGLLAALLALGVSLSWRMVVRPLQALSHASDSMASGAPGETVSPEGPREILELATAFNRMSLGLQDSQEMLESRIAERTQELRESQEFAELLLDSIDQRVVVIGTDYRIIKANTAALRMHGPALIGSKCHEVFEGSPEPLEDYPARRTFETGRPASAERSQQTLGGSEAVHIETYPVLGSAGQIQSVIEIGRVVTAEKQLQMQMVYQEKMAAFGQLAAGVTHEIGNPLAAIESQLQLAQKDPSRVQETLAIVHKQVARIGGLLRELTGFARRRQDDVMLASVNQIIEDVTRLLSHDPRARNVSIASRLADKLPGIRTKEDQLMQVLLNLGLNALDAMPDGGELVFESSAEDGEILLRVRDKGRGVCSNDLPHLFEPFFTTKEPGKGTGLGLFVSKGIVTGMGGELELEETSPNGSSFAIRLPGSVSESDGAS